MKKLIGIGLLLGLLGCTAGVRQEPVTMTSLLREMVNRRSITEWPEQVPYRTLQASSYNRASVAPDQQGWFADSDGIFCIRTEKNREGQTEWVLMEDEGPGAITKIWAVCFYYNLKDTVGANVNIYLDGSEKPVIRENFFELVKGRSWIHPPLADESCRAGNIYLPIPYAKSCKVTMDRKVFYNAISYRSYPEGTPVKTFTMEDYHRSAALVDSVSRVLTQGVYTPLQAVPGIQPLTLQQTLSPRKQGMLQIWEENQAIEQLTFRIQAADTAQALRSTVLKISFDGEQTVWSPLGDFFTIGVGRKPYQMWERAVEEDGTMICRWMMPFKKTATVELENLGQQEVDVEMEVVTTPYTWSDRSLYFHGTWRMDEPTPTSPLFDYNLVQVKGQGLYVGDQFTVLNPAQGWWGEGDEKVYVDRDTFPSLFGTGTEDYYGWAGGVVPTPEDEFAQPFLGNIRVASPRSMGYNTCTRTRMLDAIPFRQWLDFNIESSCGTQARFSWYHLLYSVNTYWYACPGAGTNRKPLPEMAERPIMQLEELQELNERSKAEKKN